MAARAAPDYYVGLMSGTSLDGVDAVVADLSAHLPSVVSHVHIGFQPDLREALLALTRSGPDEIEAAGRLGRSLAETYAEAVQQVLSAGGLRAEAVRAIGCHGQTIRHRPEQGFTFQIGNPSLLAERTGIAVVADFRNRDMAAGGQGAPLVPAFHATAFASNVEDRVVLNLGGIANITLLPRGAAVRGFDTGPGNCLMDLWAQRHLNARMDIDGNWGAGGTPLIGLLDRLLCEPYFARPAPKSCGRELFNEAWLTLPLAGTEMPQSVQATLLELTVETVARAIESEPVTYSRLIACGGGTRNRALMAGLAKRLPHMKVGTSDSLGIGAEHVEALAFAWLAQRALEGKPGNLPEVTGARGLRILGAIYPA